MGSVCNRPEYNPGRAASLSLAGQFLTAIPNPVRPVLTRPAPTGYVFALAFLLAVEQLTGGAAMRLDTFFGSFWMYRRRLRLLLAWLSASWSHESAHV